jgi:hypothetical protein
MTKPKVSTANIKIKATINSPPYKHKHGVILMDF